MQQRTVHLFKDGTFYRAYEYSAWLCCRYIHSFQTTKRFTKAVDKELVFVGFPQASLSKFLPQGIEPAVSDDRLDFPLPESVALDVKDYTTDYENWKQAQPLTEPKQRTTPNPATTGLAGHPVTITGVFKEVMAWNVVDHTPIEAMQFLAAIQQKLAGLY